MHACVRDIPGVPSVVRASWMLPYLNCIAFHTYYCHYYSLACAHYLADGHNPESDGTYRTGHGLWLL